MTTRPLITVPEPPTGWVNPWPDAFEVADAVAPSSWTLVSGLMVQLHAVIARVAVPRATTDVDAALHLETGVHTYGDAAASLRSIGYELETEQSAAAGTTDEVAIDAMDAEAADAELAAIADGAETRSLSDVADSLEIDRSSLIHPEIR